MSTKTDILNITANVNSSSAQKDSVIRVSTSSSKTSGTSTKTKKLLNALDNICNSVAPGAVSIKDGSFDNPVLKLGLSNESLTAAQFVSNMITFQRWTITNVYHGSWIFRRIIDRVSQDMWSSGINILGDATPEAIVQVQKSLSRLRSYLIWVTEQARLYGGAAALIMVDDGTDDLSKPLNLRGIKKGTPIQLWGTDRWFGMSTSTEKVTNYKSRDFNTPKYYNFFVDDTKTDPDLKVHHSRVLRFVNRKSVRLLNSRLNGWGISELEHIYQELMNHENAKNSASALVDKALLEIVRVGGLRGVMQGLTGGSAASEAVLAGQMYGIQNFRTNNLVLMDKDNEYQNYAYSFSGISELLETQRDSVAGAAEMPKVLIYGDTKGGLTSDSPAEMLFYAGTILGKQDEMLRPVLDKLLPILFVCNGFQIPSDLDYEFESIIDKTQASKIELLDAVTRSAEKMIDLNLMTHETALKEIRQVQKLTGFGSNITEADEELAKTADIPESENSGGEQTPDMDENIPLPTPEREDNLYDEAKSKILNRLRMSDKDSKARKEIINIVVDELVKLFHQKYPQQQTDVTEKLLRGKISNKQYDYITKLATQLGAPENIIQLIYLIKGGV